MPSREDELRYLQDGADEIEHYLISGASSAPAAGWAGAARSRLTLAGLLLAQKRLSGFNLSPPLNARLETANQRIAATREHWREHWGQKAAREFQERLTLWSAFLKDYFLDPGSYYRDYSQRVQWRVMLQLLEREIDSHLVETQNRLTDLDARMQSAFIPGAFIWEEEISRVFPAKEFWYLYGSLKETRS
jgi:hypothetical protein